MKHLKLWTRPDSYCGPEYPDYYKFLGRGRDSDILANSNFECALEQLGGETKRNVIVMRASHWACGWVEQILIHKSAKKKLEIAESIAEALADYPVLDDSDFSERESESLESDFTYYRSDFERELRVFLKIDDLDSFKEEHVEHVLRDIHQESAGYSGTENAWVSASAIERAVKQGCGKHGMLTRLIEDGNEVAKALAATQVKETA